MWMMAECQNDNKLGPTLLRQCMCLLVSCHLLLSKGQKARTFSEEPNHNGHKTTAVQCLYFKDRR